MSATRSFLWRWDRLTAVLLAGVSFIGIAAIGLAAEQPMTLEEIVNTAILNNPAVIETQKRWEEKKSRIRLATAQPNPKIGIMKDDIPKNTLNIGEAMMTEISISQELMLPSKIRAMGRMAENEAAMSKAEWSEKRLEVYAQTKQAYYDYLYARQALVIGREAQALMGQLASLAQVNYSTGMVPLQDTLKAQTEYSQMAIDLSNMASMETVARAKLNNLMGRSAAAAFEVKEEFYALPPEFDLAELLKTAASEKPAIAGMEYGLAMAENGLDLAKRQQLPDFELSYGYKMNKGQMIEVMDDGMGMPQVMASDQPDTWRIELMAMIPLWQGKNKAEIKAAEASREASRAALQSMKNMAELDVQMTLTEAQATWRQIELYQHTIVPQAEQTYQAAVVGYTNGKVDFMTVLEGVNTLRNARLGLYKARVDYEKAVANLEKAVGKPLSMTADIMKVKK
ncbi:TolC family protein [Acetonema longum]|uniref:Outer membrane protein n=1 Tax=Acetonema longum DSM 6540 TaxID=1009370 RepID=F7NGN1_9FIRM|nr:TolC family protein [Acetonema longum]EGO64835.1 outer membrane protein [Acetonema longum DSM 6540]